MSRKYEMTSETIKRNGVTLYKIRALRDIGDDVAAGDYGGAIESEDNLSQEGECWLYSGTASNQSRIYGDARIHCSHLSDNAEVYGDAIIEGCLISGNAEVYGGEVFFATVKDNAEIYDDVAILGVQNQEQGTRIYGNAEIYGKSVIYAFSEIGGNAIIHGNAKVFAKIGGHAEISGNARVMDDLRDGKIIGTNYIYG